MATRLAAARFTFVRAALVVELATVAAQSGAHAVATLGLGVSRARGPWLVVLACGVALVVGQAAPAASGDAVARRIVRTHHSMVKARFVSVEACVDANSAPCLQNAAFAFYGAAMRAKTEVGALRARPLSARVRSGVDRDIRALDLQAQYGNELYRAAQALDIHRIFRALAHIRYTLAAADRAIALIYS